MLISSFILLNVMGMIRTHLPLDEKFFRTIYKPIDSYLSFFSIYQDWVMFSPNPAKLDSYITAEVEFTDGSKEIYSLPRNSELSWVQRYMFGEKYRKIMDEAIRRNDHQYMWKDTAKFALRKLKDTHFHKIPLRVNLTRHWNITPEMNDQFIPHLQKKQHFEEFKFYTYEVI